MCSGAGARTTTRRLANRFRRRPRILHAGSSRGRLHLDERTHALGRAVSDDTAGPDEGTAVVPGHRPFAIDRCRPGTLPAVDAPWRSEDLSNAVHRRVADGPTCSIFDADAGRRRAEEERRASARARIRRFDGGPGRFFLWRSRGRRCTPNGTKRDERRAANPRHDHLILATPGRAWWTQERNDGRTPGPPTVHRPARQRTRGLRESRPRESVGPSDAPPSVFEILVEDNGVASGVNAASVSHPLFEAEASQLLHQDAEYQNDPQGGVRARKGSDCQSSRKAGAAKRVPNTPKRSATTGSVPI